MDASATRGPKASAPTFAELFTPKLVTVLREGYGWGPFRADAIAGLTVAIVALPLSMAIAIASGVSPDRGLYTAIVGGFLISALGGSRFQIGGPAGAFIVLVAQIVERHGYDGLVLATLMAGADPDRGRLSAARHLHQVHPLPGDGRLHRRHRRHHLRQPAQGTARPRHRAGAGSAAAEARSHLRERIRHAQAGDRRAVGCSPSPSFVGLRRLRPNWPGLLIAVAVTAALTCAPAARRRDHRHPLRRHAAHPAGAGAAAPSTSRRCAPSARCRRLRAARRHRDRCCRPWSPTA